MKIKKFRIWNYKSIRDSGDCYLRDGVTVFAGKNESGKSSILQALADFNVEKSISEKSRPIEEPSLAPRISIVFEISKEDISGILTEYVGGQRKIDIPDQVEIELTKDFPNSYSSSLKAIYKAGLLERYDHRAGILAAQLSLQQRLKELGASSDSVLPTVDLAHPKSTAAAFEKIASEVGRHLPERTTEEIGSVVELFNKVVLCLRNLDAAIEPDQTHFINGLKEYIPNFILFSSFDDVFPSEIPLSELKTNKWISDLEQMSDFDVATIISDNGRAKITHKSKLNASLNSDFLKYWSQDVSKIVVDWDNQKLNFWIEENGHYYEPEIRSQGRKWHLAFYIRVSARARENVRNVILIDEPGLYLHANAQQDILSNLEEAGKEVQVIFSTHSPYLIEPDKLERVRLVQKLDERGTVVENKIHAVSDKETLTPILTAIGLHLNRGIVGFDKNKNVIVEGPSDYYFLNGFKLITDTQDINFVSGGGAGNMPFVGTILQGWGSKVLYLYDNEKSFKEATKNIKTSWLTLTSEILLRLPVEGAIEDMFSRADFAKLILEVDEDQIKGKNSEHMKGKDKVLTAKSWLDRVTRGEQTKISSDSLGNAKKLMAILKTAFEGQ